MSRQQLRIPERFVQTIGGGWQQRRDLRLSGCEHQFHSLAPKIGLLEQALSLNLRCHSLDKLRQIVTTGAAPSCTRRIRPFFFRKLLCVFCGAESFGTGLGALQLQKAAVSLCFNCQVSHGHVSHDLWLSARAERAAG